jgi:hypothetical protein
MKNSIVGVIGICVFTASSTRSKKIKLKIEFHVSGNCEMCKKKRSKIEVQE